MNIFWLWALWMCGWISRSLISLSDEIGWKIFILFVTISIYAAILFKIDTIITII